MNFFMSMLLSFLPRKYRQAVTADGIGIPAQAALFSGILETLISLGLFIRGYFAYANARYAALPTEVMTGAAEKGGESMVMLLGGFVLIEYIFQLTTIVLMFLVVEGLVRTIAALASDEVIPSLPLQAIAILHTHLEARHHENQLGERIRDEVEPNSAGDSLQISSCRPKPWTKLTTIEHQGVFYEVVGETKSAAPRPFRYTLRKKPPTAVIRGIHPYDPDEVLQPTK